MRGRFLREVASAGLPEGPGRVDTVTASQIDHLPEPAERDPRFDGGGGTRTRLVCSRLGFTGRFRTKPPQPWMKCEAWQYDNRLGLARIFHIRILLGGILPIVARDSYVDHHGRMLVKLVDLFTLADGTGEEYDIGELVTYLNDAVLVAPSMLLVPEVSWSSVDSNSFDLALTDHGRTVAARVSVDASGAPTDFSTTDRFCYNPDQPKQLMRARWTTPVAGWEMVDGRLLPTAVQAVWHLPEGPFAYADVRPVPGTLAFNVPPGT